MQNICTSSNKRKILETSPEIQNINKRKMEENHLIQIIKDTINTNLDEKLKNLPTKADIEEIKGQICSVNSEVSSLKIENQQLKDKLAAVKKENENNKRDIAWLENYVKSNKLFIKGLQASKNPIAEVSNLFEEKLNVSGKIIGARKIFERNSKMAVIVELDSTKSIEDVFRNTNKLAGSTISVERDLMPHKQEFKKAMLILKRKILEISKEYKVTVREDKLKINNQWFKWNRENKLISGNSDGKTELLKIYGNKINVLNVEFDIVMQTASSKN